MRAALATLLSVLLVSGPASAARLPDNTAGETRVRGSECVVLVLVPARVLSARGTASGKTLFGDERASESAFWLQPDRLGTLAGANYYLFAAAKPTIASDPTGLTVATNSFDALFFVNFGAWLQIAMEIGMISLAAAGGAAAVATFAEEYGGVQQRNMNIVRACVQNARQTSRVLYRGLSVRDLNEFNGSGQVRSNFARYKGSLSDAVQEAARDVASDPAVAINHMMRNSFRSPWISVTKSYAVAEEFATGVRPGLEPPSHRVLRISTRRRSVPSFFGGELSLTEREELLFFFLSAPPDEQLELVH